MLPPCGIKPLVTLLAILIRRIVKSDAGYIIHASGTKL